MTPEPKTGAQCVSSARWDLRGGPPERAVPTAIVRAGPEPNEVSAFIDDPTRPTKRLESRRARTPKKRLDRAHKRWRADNRPAQQSPRAPTRRGSEHRYTFSVISSTLERHVLTAPDVIAHAAAGLAADSDQAWMLRQPRTLRRSFAEEALGRGEIAERIWMLRQADDVREAYVREVLGG